MAKHILAAVLIACATTGYSQEAHIVAQHDNGNPSVVVYIKGKGKNQEKVKEEGYYENGTLEYVGEFKNGLEHGTFLYYYEDGTLHIEEEWKNGKENGKVFEYSPDGQLALEQTWKDGYLIEEIAHQ